VSSQSSRHEGRGDRQAANLLHEATSTASIQVEMGPQPSSPSNYLNCEERMRTKVEERQVSCVRRSAFGAPPFQRSRDSLKPHMGNTSIHSILLGLGRSIWYR
jgi:hypothetical protein